jgi:hypothetical protein
MSFWENAAADKANTAINARMIIGAPLSAP